jgi:small conductance mechanosensitive channel
MAEEEKWGQLFRTVPQVLRINKLGDSGIDIKVVGEVKPLEQWAIMGQLRLRIKKAFDKEGIEIPWPHTKVYFGNKPGDE